MKTQREQLFGGALVAAGMAGGLASTAAADFIPLAYQLGFENKADAFLFNDNGYTGYFDEQTAAVFAADQYAGGYGAYASAYSGSTLMGVRFNLPNLDYWTSGEAEVRQWFTVDEDGKEVTIEWDFTNVNTAEVKIFDLDAYTYIFAMTAPSAGSETISLSASGTYQFRAVVSPSGGETGSGWANISNVPAPGSVALLGLAVVAGGRRRRE